MPKKLFSKSQKKVILARQEWKCSCCGKLLSPKSKIPPQFDHVEAEGLGGLSVTDNGQALCPDCHALKTAKDYAKIVDERRRKGEKAKPSVDEYTPIIRVYKASENPALSKVVYNPQRFYWNITVENIGPGVAVEVDFAVASESGNAVGNLHCDHLYPRQPHWIPTPYNPLTKSKWLATVTYTDAKGRKYPKIEKTIASW